MPEKRTRPVHCKNIFCTYPIIPGYISILFMSFPKNCLAPMDASSIPPSNKRPADFVYWSNISAWKDTEAGFGGNYGDGTYGPPRDGDDVKIPTGTISCKIIDSIKPSLRALMVRRYS